MAPKTTRNLVNGVALSSASELACALSAFNGIGRTEGASELNALSATSNDVNNCSSDAITTELAYIVRKLVPEVPHMHTS